LLESAGMPVSSPKSGALPLEVADDPCWVLLSSTGLLARTLTADPLPTEGGRSKHDVIVGAVRTTARGEVGLVTSRGRMIRLSVMELPALPATAGVPSLSGGAPLAAFVDLPRGEEPLTLASLGGDAPGLALGTAQGVVKRVTTDYPARSDFDLIRLLEGDRVIGGASVPSDAHDLVFLTSDAQLLRFPAASVRPQGRGGGGMAGIKLASGQSVVWFGLVDPTADAIVVTSSGSSGSLPGTEPGSLKVTPYAEYPAKGRATGGVRCHRFLKGEDTLVLAWAGGTPARAAAANGVPIELPPATGKRDGSGSPASTVIARIAGPV
jgi:DNA gyrase subunit A